MSATKKYTGITYTPEESGSRNKIYHFYSCTGEPECTCNPTECQDYYTENGQKVYVRQHLYENVN